MLNFRSQELLKMMHQMKDETRDNWINPFGGSEDLVSLSTAVAAPKEITDDLLMAKQRGQVAYKKIRDERLEKDPADVKFHDPLLKHKLKTFADLGKKKKHIKGTGKKIILKADCKLFGQMILIAQSRKDLSMKYVLCHPLGPLPWSLATPEGQPQKINNAALAKSLKKGFLLLNTFQGHLQP